MHTCVYDIFFWAEREDIWEEMEMLITFTNVFLQVRNDHVAPIYVINLLISDPIQLCCMIVWLAQPKGWKIHGYTIIIIYYIGVIASVCFMVCVALER